MLVTGGGNEPCPSPACRHSCFNLSQSNWYRSSLLWSLWLRGLLGDKKTDTHAHWQSLTMYGQHALQLAADSRTSPIGTSPNLPTSIFSIFCAKCRLFIRIVLFLLQPCIMFLPQYFMFDALCEKNSPSLIYLPIFKGIDIKRCFFVASFWNAFRHTVHWLLKNMMATLPSFTHHDSSIIDFFETTILFLLWLCAHQFRQKEKNDNHKENLC